MFTKILCLFGTSLALLPYTSLAWEDCLAPSASLEDGVIIGTTATAPGSTVTVNQFLGVPFASKPVRFAMPEPPCKWDTPLNTTKQAPACPQQFNYPRAYQNLTIEVFDTPGPPAGESEDCLYLDVYAPATATENKTVMFFLFGGSMIYGSNSLPKYHGTSFAANQDVIVVAPNYRTNVFGFSGSPQIPYNETNVGWYDQRLALEWVQRNIHAFGGDPAAVTIFGSASGATSVDNFITTMPDNPPFRAAILQSGQAPVYGSMTNGTRAWDTLAEKLNCSTEADVLNCVRAANATTIIEIIEVLNLNFAPAKDNITELQNPEAARKAGNVARVPILAGTTSQEGRANEYGQNNITAWLTALLPNRTAGVEFFEKEYPVGATANGWTLADDYDRISAIYTDVIYQCPLSLVVNDTSSAGIPAWRYMYNATFPNIQPLPGLSVYHTSEVPVIFGNLPISPASTEFEVILSKYLQTVWANFAKYPMAGPPWPQFPSIGILGSSNQTLTTIPSSAGLDVRCLVLNPILQVLPGGSS